MTTTTVHSSHGGTHGSATRHGLARLRARVNDLLEEFWQKIGREHTGVSGRVPAEAPQADLSAGAGGLDLALELPGMDESDIEVSLRGRVLTIAGEKRVEREESGRTYLVRERAYGAFSRRFPLPESVDLDRIAASYDRGVLRISAPPKAGARPQKKIEISPR